MHKNSSFPIDFDEDFVENIFSLKFYWGGQEQANRYTAYFSYASRNSRLVLKQLFLEYLHIGPARSPQSQLLNCNFIKNS